MTLLKKPKAVTVRVQERGPCMACVLGRHAWQPIVNEREEACLYCPRCGSEQHEVEGAPGGTRVEGPPPPAWTARNLAVRLGRTVSPSAVHWLTRLMDHVALGAWLRQRGLRPGPGLGGREAVHAVATSLCDGQTGLLYLEFGVYRGATLRLWTEQVRHGDTKFIGFDSFQGLPHHWRPEASRGSFNLEGVAPTFDDPRVRLVAGRFEDTLREFEVPEHQALVVNIDSDLYLSAHTVLWALAPHLRPGTLLYFDELNDACGELRALDEFLTEHKYQVQVVARSRNWSHWLFRIVESTQEPLPQVG